MLDRQKGNIVFECDGCGAVGETNTGDFTAALNMIKRDGWHAIKEGSDWCHYCSRCRAVPGVHY
jgi:hypothetical protein